MPNCGLSRIGYLIHAPSAFSSPLKTLMMPLIVSPSGWLTLLWIQFSTKFRSIVVLVCVWRLVQFCTVWSNAAAGSVRRSALVDRSKLPSGIHALLTSALVVLSALIWLIVFDESMIFSVVF